MAAVAAATGVRVSEVRAAAYRIPTDRPESDGTFAWDATSVVVVEVAAAGATGLGWTYAPRAAAVVIEDELADVVSGCDALDVGAARHAMRASLRNAGYPGIGAAAVSALDVALWDLKARLLELPLVALLGRAHAAVPVYGSGGFCSYSDDELAAQLAGWVTEGIPRVKMKVGRDPARDLARVGRARAAIGDEAALYVDANGAFSARQALSYASAYAALGVSWFEEPVSSLDIAGLRLVRESAPAGIDVAAGEYAYAPSDFRALLGAVDCLQADVTRCGGITGFLEAAGLAAAFELELSSHGAPQLAAHVLAAVPKARHLEWFHDHVRIERALFDGFLEPEHGAIRHDGGRPGLGLELRAADAERFRV